MFAIIACLAGVFAILLLSEILAQRKILSGDLRRQFVHIAAGSFIAFWPWLVSFTTIAWLGAVMLAVVLLNRRKKLADFYTNIERKSYGDICYALAIIATALMTDEKAFFALGMLTMALADGLANIIGQRYGKNWRYKFAGHTKTVLGSMTVWMVSMLVLGVGLLLARDAVDYSAYTTLLIAVPPVLVLVENIALWGLDNLLVPIIVVAALNFTR
jgi:dolichol kinase